MTTLQTIAILDRLLACEQAPASFPGTLRDWISVKQWARAHRTATERASNAEEYLSPETRAIEAAAAAIARKEASAWLAAIPSAIRAHVFSL